MQRRSKRRSVLSAAAAWVPGVLSPLQAWAESAAAPPLRDPLPAGDIVNVGVSLMIIIAAIVALGWAYRRAQGLRGPRRDVLQVLATQPLGHKERVLLVRIADKQLVLGVTASQMQTLLVLDDDGAPEAESPAASGFAARLKLALSGGAR